MTPIVQLNGQVASAEDLRPLAIGNYGHFTAMQVRGRAVQGLAHHIARLQAGTRELFAVELSESRIRDALRQAVLAGPADTALRLTVFARGFDYRQPDRAIDADAIDLLVTLGPPASGDKPPMRVKTCDFVRPLPHIKHVGTFPLFHYRRQAVRAGFDDALFLAPGGAIVEGSIWNIGFWDGQQVIWPQGPALRGTHEALLQAGLGQAGIAQSWRELRLADLDGLSAAFACNASGMQAIVGIDDRWHAPPDPALMATLGRALDSQPWQPLA